jgi:hypothetical protein
MPSAADGADPGWEALGMIETTSGTVAFADPRALGDMFRLRSDLLVPSGTVDEFNGSIVMHATDASTPLPLECYFDAHGAVTAAQIHLLPHEAALETSAEWEETGVLSLMLGRCVAGDPRRMGDRYRIDFNVRPARYMVERLLIRAETVTGEEVEEDGVAEEEPPTVLALRMRAQGKGQPSTARRG